MSESQDDSDTGATFPFRSDSTSKDGTADGSAETAFATLLSGSDLVADATSDLAGNATQDSSFDHIVGMNLSGYKILGPIGRGGMGVVYKAMDLELNRQVAVKVLPSAALMDVKHIARFKNEARAVAQLNHPNIVPVFRVGSERGIHFYAMQLINGQNLSQIIGSILEHLPDHNERAHSETRRRGSTDTHGVVATGLGYRRINVEGFALARSSRRGTAVGRELFEAIASLGADIALSLSHAHDQGVIHRDIKPSNIMLDADGKPWLTDFGLAQVRDTPSATQTGDIVGTLRYMSPEQASGQRYLIDHRTDIYSLGATLYELVTLHKPFGGQNARELLRQVSFEEPAGMRSRNPSIPQELEIVITKAIAKNPLERYETAAAFAEDLRRFAEGQPIHARRASFSTQAKRWLSRHQLIAAAIGIIVLTTTLISTAASGLIYGAYADEKEAREQVEQLLKKSEGLRLIAHASLQSAKNPGLSMALAVSGAQLTAGPEINAALLTALETNHERRTLQLRDRVESSSDISFDGRFVVTAASKSQSDNLPALWVGVADGAMQQLQGEQGITSVAFHPSSPKVLTASSSGWKSPTDNALSSHESAEACLWKQDGSKVRFEHSRLAIAQRECFSADGRTIVLPGLNNAVAIYRCDNGQRLCTFRIHSAQVMRAVHSRDGQFAASQDATGQVCLWNADDATLIKSFAPQEKFGSRSNLAFVASSNFLVVAGNKGTNVYSTRDLSVDPISRWSEPIFVLNPAFDRIACFWDFGRTLNIRDAASGVSVAEHAFPNGINSLQYATDGRSLLVASDVEVQTVDESLGALRYKLVGHTARILALSVARESSEIVSSSVDKTVRVWTAQTQMDSRRIAGETWHALPTLFGTSQYKGQLATGSAGEYHSFTLSAQAESEAVFSAVGRIHQSEFDSRYILSFDRNSVRLTDNDTSRTLAETQLDTVVEDAMICPGSQRALIVCDDGRALLWHAQEQRHQKLTTLADPCTAWNVSPDGSRIGLGLREGKCLILDGRTGAIVRELPHKSSVQCIEFLDSRNEIATVDGRGTIFLWKQTEENMPRIFALPNSAIAAVRVSQAHGIVVGYPLHRPGKVCSWKLDSGELLHSQDVKAPKYASFHADLPVLALALQSSGGVLQWNPLDGSMREVAARSATAVEFVGDQLIIAEAGTHTRMLKYPMTSSDAIEGATLKFVDARSGDIVRKVELPYEPSTLSIDRNTGRIAISAMSWSVTLAEPLSGKLKRSSPFATPVNVVQSVGQTSRWAIACNDGCAALIDADGKQVRQFASDKSSILCGHVSPDGQLFATGNLKGAVVIWEVASGEIVDQFDSNGAVRYVQFNPTNHYLLTAAEDNKLRYWDLRTKKLRQLEFPDGIQAVHLSVDGKRALIITGSDKAPVKGIPNTGYLVNGNVGTAALVELSDFSKREIAHPAPALAGAMESAGTKLALVSESGTVYILDCKNLEPLTKIECQPNKLQVAAFSPSGDKLATLDDDGLQVWDAFSGALLIRFERPQGDQFGRTLDRHSWNPFVAGESSLMTCDSRLELLPLNLLETAEKISPRPLTAAERQTFQIDQFARRNNRW